MLMQTENKKIICSFYFTFSSVRREETYPLRKGHPNVEKPKMKITDRVPPNIFWDIIFTTTET